MDLSNLESATFASRHVEMSKTDPESANTIMMWLFGFSAAKSGSHMFDPDSLDSFRAKLLDYCTKHPKVNLADTLTALKTP